MIYNKHLLLTLDQQIQVAMKMLHYGLGHYDLQVLIGRGTEDEFYMLSKQGEELAEVNRIRQALGKHKLLAANNFKIVNKEWMPFILEGKGVVFFIQKKAYKFRTNLDIENTFAWLKENMPLIHIDTVHTKKYDVFFICYHYEA